LPVTTASNEGFFFVLWRVRGFLRLPIGKRERERERDRYI